MTMQKKQWRTILVSVIFVSLLAACSSARPTAMALMNDPLPLAQYDRYLDFAEQALHRKKYGKVKGLLEKVFLQYPDNVRAKLLLAEMYFFQGKMGLALVSFKRLIDEPDIKARAMQGYGLALLTTGKADEAVIILQKAIEMDVALWRVWNGLGYYYDGRQDWEKSEACYSRVIALQQKSSILYNNRGFSRLLQKRTDGAIADLLKATQMAPDNMTAHLNLQLALATAGHYRQAMSLSARDLQANGLNNVGYVAFLKGDYFNAESFLTQAMETSYWFHEKAWKNLELLHRFRDIEAKQSARELSPSQ